MRASRVRTAVLLLVAVLVGALLGAGLSPASAAGLSKKTVKKIAGKVVAAQAPKLSVARAASAAKADDAATLGGLSPSALQTSARQYVLQPKGTSSSSQVWTLSDVPAGRWLVSYTVSLDVSPSGGQVSCAVVVGTRGLAVDNGAPYANESTCSGSTVVDVPVGGPVRFGVTGSGAIADLIGTFSRTSTVTFTRVDALTSVTAP